MAETGKSILKLNDREMNFSLLRWFVLRYIVSNGIFIEFNSIMEE
jgi:hypothetical protein